MRSCTLQRGGLGGGGGPGGELQYRSDSIKRVYEAQHHFVLAQVRSPTQSPVHLPCISRASPLECSLAHPALAQLTAPGVEAFLADDFSDDDDAPLSRSTSKFV